MGGGGGSGLDVTLDEAVVSVWGGDGGAELQ